jgi:hypothetical protein
MRFSPFSSAPGLHGRWWEVSCTWNVEGRRSSVPWRGSILRGLRRLTFDLERRLVLFKTCLVERLPAIG